MSTDTPNQITALVQPRPLLFTVAGGQYGSEGKGAVAAALIDRLESLLGRTAISVRVGGPNAGHTAYDKDGIAWALRQVPVGAVVSERCRLVISQGSEVDYTVLNDEVARLEAAGHKIRPRLQIDPQATVLEQRHIDQEANSDLNARTGSTAKGIGAARAERIWRQAAIVRDLNEAGYTTDDTRSSILYALANGNPVVIEGTQGHALGLHAGHYPQCTSGDVDVTDMLAQCGLPATHPSIAGNIAAVVVLRVNPIRVAGNSGPIAGETDWDTLGLQPELTTVTKKVRRVGSWDWGLARSAIEANGGPRALIALTMLDHAFPEVAGLTDVDDLSGPATEYYENVQRQLGARVVYLGTGNRTGVWV